jgi:PAS domain S-box-containing protein
MISNTELLQTLPVAVYMTDSEGCITFYNEAAAELWGQRPEIGKDRWCGSWRLYWPDGRPMAHDECPMALTLKEGQPVRGAEAILERPDGTRIPFIPFPTPLRDASGRLTGAINVLVDITARKQSEIKSAWLAAIVTSSDDAVIGKTLDGTVTSWNAAAARIFGYEESEMVGQSITRIIPPELQAEEKQILARLKQGKRIEHFETVRMAKDGHRINISLTVSPVRDKSGMLIGASKVGRDISERKRAEETRRLLLNELSHRVKNTLATVQSIARQTLHRARSPAEFVSTFSGRVQALAQAHTLLTENTWQGAKMRELVRDQLQFGGIDDNRISYSGPVLTLDPQAALHLALVLHELGTNARKYGSLSVPRGRLSINWEMQTNGGRHILLDWAERDGPEVHAPSERGFGTTLIEQSLHADGGTASIHYGSEGLTCHIKFPLQDAVPSGLAAVVEARPAGAKLSLLRQDADPSSLKGKRILIIEDEPLISMDLEANLTRAGCDIVGPASTLDQARLFVEKADFDAALVDANLAGRPVDELASALTRQNIPFAFVTGYGRDALPAAFGEGIVLDKPFTQEQLLTMVGQLFDRGAGIVPLRNQRS